MDEIYFQRTISLAKNEDSMVFTLQYIEKISMCAEIIQLVRGGYHIYVIERVIRGRLKAQEIIFDTLVRIAKQRCLERDLKQMGQAVPNHVRGNELATRCIIGLIPREQADCILWIVETSPRQNPSSAKRVVHELMAIWFGFRFASRDILDDAKGKFKFIQPNPSKLTDIDNTFHVWGTGRMTCFPSQVEAYVKELKDPEATDETHIMIGAGYSAAFAQISEVMSTPHRVSYINTTVKADVPTLMAAYETYVNALGPLKAIEGLTKSFTLQAYPKSLLEKTASRGGNSLGIDPLDGPLMSILLLSFWQNKEDDDKIHSTFKGVIEAVDQDAVTRGTAVPYKYMNYAAPFQDPIETYGKENKAKLQATSMKYDPEGLFQKGVSGGWKLFD
ncbi:putative fad binding domain-containing protein [Eutypa lata UCREL1]|uniref:Putative fad binding domain-containing protein n=1 Tax=Eutypa lata (strain UCR-EL1) TaxID=1287681 RepID=M7T888_EUTLA|nr:putative fad binding domain-containing protein [Eutypa lata UCREL1]